MGSLQHSSLKDAGKLKGVLVFFCLFIVMQQIWLHVANTSFGAWWINDVITQGLASTIALLQAEKVTVVGSTIIGAYASMNIANGCDGVDMMIMLVAALLSTTLTLRQKLLGALYGLLFLFIINQLRLLLLFSVLQHHRAHFTFTHGMLAPFLMLGATGIFYAWWLASSKKHSANDSSACTSH